MSGEFRPMLLPAIILGLSLLVGLSAGGYFIGKGVSRFKSDVRVVTVKGLVEREVKADQAVWTLGLRDGPAICFRCGGGGGRYSFVSSAHLNSIFSDLPRDQPASAANNRTHKNESWRHPYETYVRAGN